MLDESLLLFGQALPGRESAGRARLTEALTERACSGENRRSLLDEILKIVLDPEIGLANRTTDLLRTTCCELRAQKIQPSELRLHKIVGFLFPRSPRESRSWGCSQADAVTDATLLASRDAVRRVAPVRLVSAAR